MTSRPDPSGSKGAFIVLVAPTIMVMAAISSALTGVAGAVERPHLIAGDVDKDPCANSSVPDLLRGVCRSYCEARDCEGLGRFGSGHVCDTLLQTYVRASGALPPCTHQGTDARPLQTPESGNSHGNGLFNPDPHVAKVSITKERKQIQCMRRTNLCCIDPPQCTCCSVPDPIVTTTVEMDLVTVSARVKIPPSGSDLVVALVRFQDPPEGLVPPGGQSNTISLEMFDSGPVAVGTVTVDGQTIPIFSGDQTDGDEILTRDFYFKTPGTDLVNNCVFESDFAEMGHTLSTYQSTVVIDASSSATYSFHVEAVDGFGNIAATQPMPVAIQGTQVNVQHSEQACGAPSGNGGCLPGSASTDSAH